MKLDLELKNNMKLNNENILEKQNNFLETSLGKAINSAVNVGLKMVLPDLFENELIKIKDTLLKNGLGEAITKAVQNGLNIGKNNIGILKENFQNVGQVKEAVEKGGIIETIANNINLSTNMVKEQNLINKNNSELIKSGNNIIVENIKNSINNNLNNQNNLINNLNNYCENWNKFYELKDFNNMEKEFNKIQNELKNIMPLEDIIKKAREIENIHNLIKNKGIDFNISNDEITLSKKLIF